MEAKHTKGPWTAHRMIITPKAKDRRCGFVVNGPDDKPDDLPTRICDLRVPAGMDGFGEGEANAKLISAAPDMYDALKYAKEIIDIAKRYFPKSLKNGDKYSLLNLDATISKAIRKAEGEE